MGQVSKKTTCMLEFKSANGFKVFRGVNSSIKMCGETRDKGCHPLRVYKNLQAAGTLAF